MHPFPWTDISNSDRLPIRHIQLCSDAMSHEEFNSIRQCLKDCAFCVSIEPNITQWVKRKTRVASVDLQKPENRLYPTKSANEVAVDIANAVEAIIADEENSAIGDNKIDAGLPTGARLINRKPAHIAMVSRQI
ncbi:hypothetical protein EVAR_67510_1 [Eumeta japonica]|uniref:Uncharacterized protein n=1 Tax=Eumeta variegata TaxID=151549 RepID=A0A4C2A6X8_EUMVA|nr:hypothetical protein EVAR_67510_1 [Eumeta japonica]